MRTLLCLLLAAACAFAAQPAGDISAQPGKPAPGPTLATLKDARELPAMDRLAAISDAYAAARTRGETNVLDGNLAQLHAEYGNFEQARQILDRMPPSLAKQHATERLAALQGDTNAALATLRLSLTSTNFFKHAATNDVRAAQKMRWTRRYNAGAKAAGQTNSVALSGELGRLQAIRKPDHLSAWALKLDTAKKAGGTNYLNALRKWDARLKGKP